MKVHALVAAFYGFQFYVEGQKVAAFVAFAIIPVVAHVVAKRKKV